MTKRLNQMVEEFTRNGIKTILVTSHPSISEGKLFKYEKEYKRGLIDDIRIPKDAAYAVQEYLLSGIAENDSFKVVSAIDMFCKNDEELCSILDDDENLLLYDGSHISTAFSGVLAAKIADVILSEGQK